MKGTKKGFYLLFSLLYSLFVVVILIGVNLLAARFPLAAQVSGGLSRKLRPETLRTLSSIAMKVEIIALLPEGEDAERTRELFLELQAASPFLEAKVIDPEASPIWIQNSKIKEGERVLLRSSERESRLRSLDEIAISRALQRLTSAKNRDVCFVRGHGERSLLDLEPGGVSDAARLLTDQGFVVRNIPLHKNALSDCQVVILAGPVQEISILQRTFLLSHISQGAGVLLLLDTEAPGIFSSLLDKLGVDLSIDRLQNLETRDPKTISTRATSEHPALASLLSVGKRVILYTPGILSPRVGVNAEILLLSSSETQTSDGQIEGPYPLGIAIQNAQSRSIVLSDSEFISNARLSTGGNREFWIGAVNWLSEEPSPVETKGVLLSPENRQSIALWAQGLFPAIFVLLAFQAWRRRREH